MILGNRRHFILLIGFVIVTSSSLFGDRANFLQLYQNFASYDLPDDATIARNVPAIFAKYEFNIYNDSQAVLKNNTEVEKERLARFFLRPLTQKNSHLVLGALLFFAAHKGVPIVAKLLSDINNRDMLWDAWNGILLPSRINQQKYNRPTIFAKYYFDAAKYGSFAFYSGDMQNLEKVFEIGSRLVSYITSGVARSNKKPSLLDNPDFVILSQDASLGYYFATQGSSGDMVGMNADEQLWWSSNSGGYGLEIFLKPESNRTEVAMVGAAKEFIRRIGGDSATNKFYGSNPVDVLKKISKDRTTHLGLDYFVMIYCAARIDNVEVVRFLRQDLSLWSAIQKAFQDRLSKRNADGTPFDRVIHNEKKFAPRLYSNLKYLVDKKLQATTLNDDYYINQAKQRINAHIQDINQAKQHINAHIQAGNSPDLSGIDPVKPLKDLLKSSAGVAPHSSIVIVHCLANANNDSFMRFLSQHVSDLWLLVINSISAQDLNAGFFVNNTLGIVKQIVSRRILAVSQKTLTEDEINNPSTLNKAKLQKLNYADFVELNLLKLSESQLAMIDMIIRNRTLDLSTLNSGNVGKDLGSDPFDLLVGYLADSSQVLVGVQQKIGQALQGIDGLGFEAKRLNELQDLQHVLFGGNDVNRRVRLKQRLISNLSWWFDHQLWASSFPVHYPEKLLSQELVVTADHLTENVSNPAIASYTHIATAPASLVVPTPAQASTQAFESEQGNYNSKATELRGLISAESGHDIVDLRSKLGLLRSVLSGIVTNYPTRGTTFQAEKQPELDGFEASISGLESAQSSTQAFESEQRNYNTKATELRGLISAADGHDIVDLRSKLGLLRSVLSGIVTNYPTRGTTFQAEKQPELDGFEASISGLESAILSASRTLTAAEIADHTIMSFERLTRLKPDDFNDLSLIKLSESQIAMFSMIIQGVSLDYYARIGKAGFNWPAYLVDPSYLPDLLLAYVADPSAVTPSVQAAIYNNVPDDVATADWPVGEIRAIKELVLGRATDASRKLFRRRVARYINDWVGRSTASPFPNSIQLFGEAQQNAVDSMTSLDLSNVAISNPVIQTYVPSRTAEELEGEFKSDLLLDIGNFTRSLDSYTRHEVLVGDLSGFVNNKKALIFLLLQPGEVQSNLESLRTKLRSIVAANFKTYEDNIVGLLINGGSSNVGKSVECLILQLMEFPSVDEYIRILGLINSAEDSDNDFYFEPVLRLSIVNKILTFLKKRMNQISFSQYESIVGKGNKLGLLSNIRNLISQKVLAGDGEVATWVFGSPHEDANKAEFMGGKPGENEAAAMLSALKEAKDVNKIGDFWHMRSTEGVYDIFKTDKNKMTFFSAVDLVQKINNTDLNDGQAKVLWSEWQYLSRDGQQVQGVSFNAYPGLVARAAVKKRSAVVRDPEGVGSRVVG